MLTLEVDGHRIEAEEGDTILAALRRAGIYVPTLCHIEGLPPSGACRLCVVEVEGSPNLTPACSFPAQAGMKIRTRSPRVIKARKTIIELLLANHPDDCLYCGRSGKCELQTIARELGISQRRYGGVGKDKKARDIASPSVARDPAKCVLCGRCVRICEEVQSVAAIDFLHRGARTLIGAAFDTGLNVSTCVNCGQCIMACPTGALVETSSLEAVVAALSDPKRTVVVQHAPAVSVSLGEEIGLKPGADVDGKMVAALRRVGFARVFDTSFTADLTIMEEASELAHRIKNGGALPMFTSCSPGWIKFMEQFYPSLIPHLSTCKSPQQMLGAIIKSFFAQREGLNPAEIVSVSIMPCTAKKFECTRPEMAQRNIPDVDHVLTTREAAQLFRMFGVDMAALEPEAADTPFGERSSAGKIFGASGGVMEAALRTAHYLLTGREMDDLKIQPLRGMQGVKECRVKIGDLEVSAAVANGLGNARKLLEAVQAGSRDWHFIEVMTCPGGCIGGGGQPLLASPAAVRERMKALYTIDRDEQLRVSHNNKWVKRLYEEFLGQPLSETSHRLLHTHYLSRENLV